MDTPLKETTPREKLGESLKRMIQSGRLKEGDRLLSVRALSREYGVGAGSAHRTLRALEAEGWLESRPRSGYYVAPVSQRRKGALVPVSYLSCPQALQAEMTDDALHDDYFAPFVEALQVESERQGVDLTLRLLSQSNGDAVAEDAIRDAQGIILKGARYLYRDVFHKYQSTAAVVVVGSLIGTDFEDCVFDNVIHDTRQGVALACRHLSRLGHRRIALMATDMPQSLREIGLRNAAEHYDIEASLFTHPHEAGLDYVAVGEHLAAKALKSKSPPTAVVTHNDPMAYGVMRYCQAEGVRIPEDLSLIGCDNLPHSRHTIPTLSSIRLPFRALAEECFRLIKLRLEDPERHKTLLMVPCNLAIRESCAPPAK